MPAEVRDVEPRGVIAARSESYSLAKSWNDYTVYTGYVPPRTFDHSHITY
jgi:hypothetical protein